MFHLIWIGLLALAGYYVARHSRFFATLLWLTFVCLLVGAALGGTVWGFGYWPAMIPNREVFHVQVDGDSNGP